MKYLEKYNRYIDSDCVIYRIDREGKLVQVKPSVNNCGYEFICYANHHIICVHRLVYEAFISEIPEGMEIDHIDRNKHNNNPDNLRIVTHKENMLNRSVYSEFRKKYLAHFGISDVENKEHYDKERWWYHHHHKRCSWEV